MASYHIHKHNAWWNRLFFRLNQIRKLGVNYIVGGLVVGGGRNKPDNKFIEIMKKKWPIDICFEDEIINGKRLKKVTIKPNMRSKQNNLTLFYPGHGVTISRNSLIENMIEQVIVGNRVVVAYDQSGVGMSCNYQHPSEYTLREDVQRQALNCYGSLQSMKHSGEMEKDAKMDIYGLCFGGVLSTVAGNALKDKSDFSQVYITRAPIGIWDMAALCPDYKRFFPALDMDERNTLSEKDKAKAPVGLFARITQGFVMNVLRVVVKCLNMMTWLPNIIRRVLIYPIFASVGWSLDVRKDLKKLDDAAKVEYMSLNAHVKGSDEFVNASADMSQYVKKPLALVPGESGNKKDYYDRYYQGTDNYALLGKNNFSRYYHDMVHPDEKNTYAHQAWSESLKIKGSEQTELELVASSPQRKTKMGKLPKIA